VSFAWLIPALPFAGFFILMVGWRMPRKAAACIGAGSVGLAMAFAIWVAALFLANPPAGGSSTFLLWQWVAVSGFSAPVAITVDALSVVMLLVVTVVGFLIHLYSVDHMAGGEGYSRFFAYMNLFVGSMLTLVLADNLLLLYLGWEGVGLCSYLLIGFWYEDPANGRAARKAFIVTRIGDVALMIGLFLIAFSLGSLGLKESSAKALSSWAPGSGIAVAAAALILGGAVGKSAQLPLQTWLPDAMAGPSPVSALIHAATMVTAGVYLIARTNVFFSLAPAVQLAVGIVGAATLILAGSSAVSQRDIKRVLAYSTISQLGYMFLALGVGSWAGAIFHLVTHALFKSLLFLSAGVVILAMNEEHDIFAMGGLARKMPFTFWVFLIGCFGLTALPPVTSGFSSKDLILAAAWSSGGAGRILWAVALAGVFLTSLYTFRMVFIAFFGPPRPLAEHGAEGGSHASHGGPGRGFRAGPIMGFPLAVLALLCVIGGLLNLPATLGGAPFLFNFLDTVLPHQSPAEGGALSEGMLQLISLVVSLAGIPFAYLIYKRSLRPAPAHEGRPSLIKRFLASGWGFDSIYDVLLVRPFTWIAGINRADVINGLSEGVGAVNMFFSRLFRVSQTGRVRWYAVGLAAGGLLIVAAVVML
jgi:NADH-quinone oxidoreductase subunit L